MGNPKLDDWTHATEGATNPRQRQLAMDDINYELLRSYRLHGIPRWGRHEAYAIILEELDEVKEAVFDDLPYLHLRKELIQTAAMIVRYIETEPRFHRDH